MVSYLGLQPDRSLLSLSVCSSTASKASNARGARGMAASRGAGAPRRAAAAAALGRALCSAECAGAVSWSNRLMAEHLRARRLEAAREVFDGMPRRDVVSWNTLMAVHARSGAHGRAAGAFLEMRRQGFRPDHTSFSTLLSCCARLEALELGRCVHGLAFKTRSSGNVFVGASLITMYANCGLVSCLEQVLDGVDSPNVALWNALLSGLVMNHCVANACKVFDQMPVRNVVSWTAMIKGYLTAHKVGMAFQLFKLMPVKNSVSWCVMIGGFVTHERFSEAVELFISLMRNGDEVTNVILVKILNAFAGMKSIRGGRCIHGFAVKSGFVYDPVLEASLVLMYCKLLDISEARLEFDKMEGKHVASWNAMLCGYIYWAKIDEARNLFDSMTNRDKISWNSMINGYINHGRIADATEVYSKMTEKSLEAATALMSCFIDNGMLDKAQDIFYNMPQTDVISCTALLFGYVKGGHMDDALDLFHRMHRRTVVTYNVMISGLLHQGKVTEAYKLFNETPRRDSLTWRCLVSGLATNGLIHEALQFYRRMVLSNIRPNESVVSCIMSCLSNYSMMVHGQQFHAITIKIGLDSHVLIQNSLISLYCKCGEMIIAQSIFDLMAKRDKVTWNTMIHGYALNNLGQNAVGMFENMKKAQVDPDDITFLGVLSACNHMSLLEEAKYFFNVMAYTYRILPNIMHYACMVDLFCRKGMIKEAEGLVKSMPFEPDSAIWTSLLSGCRLTGNDKLAEHAASQLIAIDPSTKMPYLHLISVHGLNNKSSVIDSLRSQIKSTATEKDVGYSWI